MLPPHGAWVSRLICDMRIHISYHTFCIINNCKFIFLFILYEYKFMLNTFNSIVLSKKNIPYIFYFIVDLIADQRLGLPYNGVRLPCWHLGQRINLTGGCESLKRAATSRNQSNRGYGNLEGLNISKWCIWLSSCIISCCLFCC